MFEHNQGGLNALKRKHFGRRPRPSPTSGCGACAQQSWRCRRRDGGVQALLERTCASPIASRASPAAGPAPPPTPAPQPPLKVPRSIIEVDNGKVLGFSAELSEVGLAGRSAVEARAQLCSWYQTFMTTLPRLCVWPCLRFLQDHPGFNDAAFKQRRVDICNLARTHRM
jgi:hypothetical protein